MELDDEAARVNDKSTVLIVFTYIPPMVTVAQVRSEKAGVPSAGPVAARM